MTTITIYTEVNAPIQVVFDLSRSIDLHKISTEQTREEAITGTTTGLISLGETVTWRAKHFGIWQKLTSKITAFDSPHHFTDEMVKGAFKRFKHDHFFEEKANATQVTDVFAYTSPFGIIGKLADWLFLKHYMTRLLKKRNEIIREFAETDEWRNVPGLSA